MNSRIEDYAFIGDRRGAALVARNGSIDWLCWPHFDSPACLAALLGDEKNGRWKLAPLASPRRTTRQYRKGTLILETVHQMAKGRVKIVDFMVIRAGQHAIIRQVIGEEGDVDMDLELRLCFDYGSIPPRLRPIRGGVVAVMGPDLIVCRSRIKLACTEDMVSARFRVRTGERAAFIMQYGQSFKPKPPVLNVRREFATTERYWTKWIGRFQRLSASPDVVKRSLITLQALTHRDSGAMIAAPTAGLPEIPGGRANWDYRYAWLRDSTFGLSAFLNAGFRQEAVAWRNWLLRAVTGTPDQIQTMYRWDGARHIGAHSPSWLRGYENAKPVHIGNQAATQRQLDIYGEILNSLHLSAKAGLNGRPVETLALEQALAARIQSIWTKPDQGIWESRGPARHFTHSKVMAWVGIDRFIVMHPELDEAKRRRLESLRDTMHAIICQKGFSKARNSFVKAFGSRELDASLLLLPIVGFLPVSDERIAATLDAIEQELVQDGLVRRWARRNNCQAEGAFIACTCWLSDCRAMQGRTKEARAYFQRVVGLCNDVGLLSEEWDNKRRRMAGNFPQALSHLALVNTALRLGAPVLRHGR